MATLTFWATEWAQALRWRAIKILAGRDCVVVNATLGGESLVTVPDGQATYFCNVKFVPAARAQQKED